MMGQQSSDGLMPYPLLIGERSSSCDGKRAFASYQQAKRSLDRHRSISTKGGRGGVRPYQCRFCQCWHVGARSL